MPKNRVRKILITGGAGFIGSSLAKHLLQRGFRVSILDDLSTGLITNLPLNEVNFYQGSVLNDDLVQNLVQDHEVIFHLAARGSVPRSIDEPIETFDVNFSGTLKILEAARKNKPHLIFSSSSSVYGANSTIPKSEYEWVSPLSPYASSKLASEGAIAAYANSYDIHTTILRFFNVYGRGQRFDHPYAAVIPKWIHLAETNKAITVFGDGEQFRDFTHISIILSLLENTMSKKINSPIPINVAFGQPVTLNEIIGKLRIFYPNLQVVYQPIRKGDIKYSANNPNRIKEIFGELNGVPLEEGINDTISWYRDLNQV
jgi:UDP-glucose 4-epimerase